MSKVLKYEDISRTLENIFLVEKNLSMQAKMAITSSVLHSSFNHWLFCGFYVTRDKKTLEIGPYQGQIIPCTHIPIGKGVCGTTLKDKKTNIVNDVSQHLNYISCDSNARSEIVVPIFKYKEVVAVLDIDSPLPSDFNEIDQLSLEKISKIIY